MKGVKEISLAFALLAAQPLAAQTTVDYDTDNDGLIDITTLAQPMPSATTSTATATP